MRLYIYQLPNLIPNDTRTMSQVIRDLAHMWNSYPRNLPVGLDHINNILIDSLGEGFPYVTGLYDETKPIGLIAFREPHPGQHLPRLTSLLVVPEYRTHGLAQLLINSCLNQAKILGYDKIQLECVGSSLVRYYRSLGWTHEGITNRQGYEINVMTKTV